jgi:hypothetical protein
MKQRMNKKDIENARYSSTLTARKGHEYKEEKRRRLFNYSRSKKERQKMAV